MKKDPLKLTYTNVNTYTICILVRLKDYFWTVGGTGYTQHVYIKHLRGGWETSGSSRLSIVRKSWILKLDREARTKSGHCYWDQDLPGILSSLISHLCKNQGASISAVCPSFSIASAACQSKAEAVAWWGSWSPTGGQVDGSALQSANIWGNLKLKMISVPTTNLITIDVYLCCSSHTHLYEYRQEFQCPFGDTEQQACWKQLASRSKLVSFYDSTPPDGRKRPDSLQHISHRRLCLNSCWASCQLKSTNMSIPVSHQQHQTIWMNTIKLLTKDKKNLTSTTLSVHHSVIIYPNQKIPAISQHPTPNTVTPQTRRRYFCTLSESLELRTLALVPWLAEWMAHRWAFCLVHDFFSSLMVASNLFEKYAQIGSSPQVGEKNHG